MSKLEQQGSAAGDTGADAAQWDSARRQLEGGCLSIVMPAYNLGHAIAGNLRRVDKLFRGRLPYEVIVVDDGSSDDTHAEIERLRSELPELKPVHLQQNSGKGAALKSGFDASTGNFVLLLDGDLDLPPAQVSHFFQIMEDERADVVIGSKRHPESDLDYPWHRKLMSIGYYWLVKTLIGLPVRDTQTGIKLLKRETLEWAVPRMLVKRFAFDLEMLGVIHGKGFRVAEAPVTLRFQGRLGCMRPAMIKRIMHDTLAIFYRMRLLRYYQSIPDTGVPDPPPLVSIVIALPAPSTYLGHCLAGIAAQTYQNYEVILLPDEATGETWPERVREVPTGKVRPAQKRNVGIEQSRGSIVAFLDDDTIPHADWLTQAVVYFSIDAYAAVGGPAVTPGRDPYLARLGGDVFANPLVSGQYRYRYRPGRVREVDDFPSCNLLVRTDVLRQLGGFRTDFWPGEDTYLCLEITKRLGRKIVYDPRVLVQHHRRSLFLPHLRQVGRYALHRGYFARRFPETSRRLSYMVPSLFVIGLAAGAILSPFCLLCRFAYLGVLAVYLVATGLATLTRNPATWLITWCGVILTHLVYGARFLAGLLSTRMPEQVQRFDHPSETGPAAGDPGGEEGDVSLP